MSIDTELAAARENTWAASLVRHASEQPHGVALRFLGASITWERLLARVDNIADWLVGKGVGHGDRVGIVMTNRPEFLESLFAITSIGAIAVPVNFRLTAPEVSYILRDSGTVVVITESALVQTVRTAADDGVTVVSTDAEDGVVAFDSVADGSWPPRTRAVVPASDPAAIMYTSGTTGHPKGAVLTQSNFRAVTDIVSRAWRMEEGDVVLAATPLFHIGGLGSALGPILLRTVLVILPSVPFDPVAVLDVMETEGVTATFMVPAQWQALCAVPGAGERVPTLRTLSWGAAPASDSLLRTMSATFRTAETVALFGQTELSPVTCVLHGEDAIRKLGSVGRPASSVQARVVDSEMRDVGVGEIGEIVYRGPNLMLGYWNDEAATEAAFRGGWFHSGDLVRRDAEGYVYVVDRLKDMIISGGENIYSAEVENVLASHPAVADVAVVGRPDVAWGEAVVAVVVPIDASDPPTVEALAAYCRTRIAAYKSPKDLLVVDVLPRNATGKVIKTELRRRVGDLGVGAAG